jgi:MerR family mercuric resistance operon transcriptional regulator
MQIGELARRLGLAPETLRFYERQGLLPAPGRRGGGRYREYDEDDAERLRLLVGLRQLDLPLDESAKLATMCASGHCDEVTDELLEELPRRRSEIRRRIDELRHLDHRLAVLERALGAGEQPQDAISVERKEVG